jgi:long-subunit fatty acid transport protein
MPQGFHLGVTWQAALQKRQMNASNQLFMMNENNRSMNRFFEGEATAPVIPSIQAAYVINDKWSVSANFAVAGGGGKCEFEQGLPMFEELIGGLVYKQGGTSYSLQQNLTGEQYVYGLQLGATYKVTENFSVFGGVRGIMANCAYEGAIANIKANGLNAAEYKVLSDQAAAAAQQYASLGMATEAAQYAAMAQQAGTTAALISDYKLDCKQDAFGFQPIIGANLKLGKLNIGAKYEFRAKINLENESNNSANLAALATTVPAVAVYGDGNIVRTDIPAYLALGAEYSFSEVRVAAGYHYFWDKDAKGSAIKAGDNSWEVVLGAEWDITDRWTISCGGQRTGLGFADSDMSDTNFSTSSYGLSLGAAYKINDMLKLNAGYLHSMFDGREFTNANGTACNYTRKSEAFGLSLDFTF